MHTTVIRYRDWVITAHARRIQPESDENLGYTAVAFIEKFEPKIDLSREAQSERARRKAYNAEGAFEHPEQAKNSAFATAKLAVNALSD